MNIKYTYFSVFPSNKTTIRNKNKAAIDLAFDLHCKAMTALLFFPYCCLIWGHCLLLFTRSWQIFICGTANWRRLRRLSRRLCADFCHPGQRRTTRRSSRYHWSWQRSTQLQKGNESMVQMLKKKWSAAPLCFTTMERNVLRYMKIIRAACMNDTMCLSMFAGLK